jgi:hypothetical protein
MPKRAKPRIADAKSIAAETIVRSEKSFRPDHADSTALRTTRTTIRGRDRTIKTAGTGLVALTGMVDAPDTDSTERRGGVVADKAGDRENDVSRISFAMTAKPKGSLVVNRNNAVQMSENIDRRNVFAAISVSTDVLPSWSYCNRCFRQSMHYANGRSPGSEGAAMREID